MSPTNIVKDVSPASRLTCNRYSEGPVFGNIADMLIPVYDIRNNSTWTYAEKHAFFQETQLGPGAWDYRSETFKDLPDADINVTGTPCQHWSRSNLMSPGIEGQGFDSS